MEKILICEDSQEGIFTGIYEAYAQKCDHDSTRIQLGEEGDLCLFAEYREIVPDIQKADKVRRTILTRFGEECYEQICYALSSWETDKGQAVYQTVVEGLKGRIRGSLMDYLGNRYVHRAFELSRAAGNEAHHLLGFLRFEETAGGILFGEIGPKNNVVPFMMPHFADRFPKENFIIFDKGRKLYGIHQAGKPWFLAGMENGPEKQDLEFSEEERQIQELFRYFCRKITIKERENEKLQRQMLPYRFQEYMVEFVNNEQKTGRRKSRYLPGITLLNKERSLILLRG